MESKEWPEPKRDTSDFLFLYPFYYRYPGILQDSPQHAHEMNLRRANKVAAKALEKVSRLSRIYDDGDYPVKQLEDPCGLLPSLAVSMQARLEGFGISRTCISLLPVLDHDMPNSANWLGRLDVVSHREDSPPRIDQVCLNQPGEGSRVQLGQWPGQIFDDGRRHDSYPAHAQAMNFIGMVDNYLDQLDRSRLVVVGNV